MGLMQVTFLAVFCSAAMAAAWLIQRRTGKSGWIDTIWTLATGIAGVLAAWLFSNESSDGRALLAAAMVTLWALRLAGHIGIRTRIHGEDARYAALMTEWGADAPFQLFRFLQIQALAAFALAIVVGVAAANPHPFPALTDVLALAIFAAGWMGATLADRQLEAFRQANRGRKAICEVGLWHYSRHPNYFFEWLGWWAYPLLAIDLSGGNPFGWLALMGPALMYFFLVHASGIPPLEKQMLASRGEAARQWQARVNAFFPGPRRENST